MSNNYLWDRSGPPDPQIANLEQTLASLRLPASSAPTARLRWAPPVIAASILAAFALSQTLLTTPPAASWQLAGESLHSGQVLRAASTPLQIDSDSIGRIELSPRSELAIVESRPGVQRFHLRAGTIKARIWAPAREVVVDTPSARAIDLGCQYSLSVDPRGDGLLAVETGWVAFQHRGQDSFIPAGARCRTRRASGPGTPYFDDAPAAFIAAIDLFDTRPSAAAIAAVLESARARDAISLWHLLPRVSGPLRAAVFQRFARLAAVPPSVTENRILRSDPQALDLCWNALHLDSAAWYRSWQRQW
jgi:hypothetical protein